MKATEDALAESRRQHQSQKQQNEKERQAKEQKERELKATEEALAVARRERRSLSFADSGCYSPSSFSTYDMQPSYSPQYCSTPISYQGSTSSYSVSCFLFNGSKFCKNIRIYSNFSKTI